MVSTQLKALMDKGTFARASVERFVRFVKIKVMSSAQGSVGLIKHYERKQLSVEKNLFCLILPHHSPFLKEVKTRTQSGVSNRNHRRMLPAGLLSGSLAAHT